MRLRTESSTAGTADAGTRSEEQSLRQPKPDRRVGEVGADEHGRAAPRPPTSLPGGGGSGEQRQRQPEGVDHTPVLIRDLEAPELARHQKMLASTTAPTARSAEISR